MLVSLQVKVMQLVVSVAHRLAQLVSMQRKAAVELPVLVELRLMLDLVAHRLAQMASLQGKAVQLVDSVE